MRLKHNIPLLYIFSGLGWTRFFLPILALFYIASAVPLEQFTVIMAVFSLTILVLEVPSGVIADILGKKNTLVVSRLFLIVEIFLIAFFDGFWVFLIAKIASGIGVSLSSGAKQALLYDTLKKIRREKEHKRISGIDWTIANVTMAFVFIIGAYLFSMHYKLPAKVSLPFAVAGFFVSLLLKEPYKSKKSMTLRNSYKHLQEGLIYFWRHDYVRYLVFISLSVSSIVPIFLSVSSAYYEKIAIPISFIGVVAFIGSMITAYSAKKADSFEAKIGERYSLRLVQILLVVGILLSALMLKIFGVFFFFFIYLSNGLFRVLVNHFINKHIETSHRATMLSIKSLGNNLATFILFPIMGYLTMATSMQISFLSFAGILVVYSVLIYLFARRWGIKKFT